MTRFSVPRTLLRPESRLPCLIVKIVNPSAITSAPKHTAQNARNTMSPTSSWLMGSTSHSQNAQYAAGKCGHKDGYLGQAMATAKEIAAQPATANAVTTVERASRLIAAA